MKKIIGLIASLLIVVFIGIVVLRIWDIEVVSLENLIRSSATLIILGIAIIILLIVYGVFFRNNAHNYNKKIGNRAHPKS